jgi:hypothetical protein
MAPIVFWPKYQPKKIDRLCRPKNGQKWLKLAKTASRKDVNDIKNFCFLHYTSPKSYLEHGPNHFLAKNQPKKLTPLYRP